MTTDEFLTAIMGIPYPSQIKNLDTASDEGAVRFDWRGVRYRVSGTFMVEEVGDGVLTGTDRAILMGAILKRHYVEN